MLVFRFQKKMSPSNRRALIVLLLLNLIVFVVDYYYWDIFPAKVLYTEAQLEAQIEAWEKEDAQRDSIWSTNLRSFDPNQVDSSFLQGIGIPQQAIKNWIRYLQSGGSYSSLSQMKWIRGLDSLNLQRISSYVQFPKPEYTFRNKEVEAITLSLEQFDPNTITTQEMGKMGLPRSAWQGIVSFRTKYRPFKERQDIYKVYGIDSSLADLILPWLEIKADSIQVVQSNEPIDINCADSVLLSRVPGLGPYRAKRILDWRTRLGGFHSLNQLLVHHIIDSLQLPQVEQGVYCGPLQGYVYLNYDDLEALQAHPYINYYLARNIIDFRERVRAFKKEEELMNIELVDDVLFSKLAPYLKVSPRDTIK